jgi:hypothetical protein
MKQFFVCFTVHDAILVNLVRAGQLVSFSQIIYHVLAISANHKWPVFRPVPFQLDITSVALTVDVSFIVIDAGSPAQAFWAKMAGMGLLGKTIYHSATSTALTPTKLTVLIDARPVLSEFDCISQ